jgi:membrane-bound lytic murein transglycosylase D
VGIQLQIGAKKVKQYCQSRSLGLSILLAALLGVCTGCASSSAPSVSTPAVKTAPIVEQSSIPVSKPEATAPGFSAIPYYPHPAVMDLCGEPVPLDNQEVSERFDREFTIVVYGHAQVYLWLKRMERYFPWIEDQLRSYGLPLDLKYVAVAESDLLPNACSPKGAAGPWQFMPKTGNRYGLDQTRNCDERYDFELATSSAFRYLRDLYGQFHNWALAIAAYNCGERRVMEEMRSQRIHDYYRLKLPLETERYVMRILAIKAVLSNPTRYGYDLPQGQGYPQLRVDKTRLNASNPTPIQDVAEAAGTTYKEIKRLNPALRADQIPAGTYEVKLPEGKGKVLEQNLQTVTSAAPPDRSTPHEYRERTASETPTHVKKHQKGHRHHIVKKGDTLTNIARRYNVSIEQLRKANKLKGSHIALGETLLIP